jgi:hypothetical protein
MFVLGIQGYAGFHLIGINHPTLALLTAIVYLFTQTLIMFFFVGTGVSVKEYTREHNIDDRFHKQSISLKRRLYPPILLNIFIFMLAFISGGAVDTHLMPGFLHGILYFAVLIHFVKVMRVQHHCFKDNTAIILNMSGIESKLEMSV